MPDDVFVWHFFCFFINGFQKAEQKIISYNKSNKYHAKRKHWGNDREHIPRHQIFIREIVSNAVDATQKLKTLANKGDFKGETGELKVCVKVDKDNGTITVSDRGLGMTEEEIDKYINQIAFSGANDFLDKYKDDACCYYRAFRVRFLLFVHGEQESGNRDQKLPRRGKGRKMEL